MAGILIRAADNGRMILVAGLIIGLVLQPLAAFMRDYLGLIMACLLFLNALRVGPKAAFGQSSDRGTALLAVLIFQLAVPLTFLAICLWFGFNGTISVALTLMMSAASISGSPNITQLSGHDPAPALRLLVLGTALLPLTILPIFSLSPAFTSPNIVIIAALKLAALIVIASGLAFAARHLLMKQPSERQLRTIDGLTVILMAVLVVGLMKALGPAIIERPWDVFKTALFAFGANLGLQVLCYFALSAKKFEKDRVGISVVAGNRNMALFLAALPYEITDALLLFVGCYQFPMYLTPILMGRLYRTRRNTL